MTNTLPTDNYIDAIRQSCKALYDKNPVKISESGIKNFLQGLNKLQYDELSIDTPMKMPLKFSSIEEEVNFIATIDLLNFGSGYRRPLHELTDRGAFDTIRFGAMSFHIGGTPMDAECYKNITLFQVSEIFQIPLTRDVKHDKLDFVTVAEPTELRPFAVGITSVLNTTGEFLLSNGYKNLAQFIMDNKYAGNKPTAHELVAKLINALPGLRDDGLIDGQAVYLFKKAQIMVYHLWFFFKDQVPETFDFEDIEKLTIFSDNVIPTILAHFGVLELPEAWKQDIESNRDIGENHATVLRAAAILACDEIVKVANEEKVGNVNNMTTGSLDVYLWRVAKEGELRKVPRFEFRDTVMF